MIDSSIPTSRVLTFVLWTVSGGLLVTAWVVATVTSWPAGIMLALTGAHVAAGAAVSNIRCFSLRTCALIRQERGNGGSDPGPRPIR